MFVSKMAQERNKKNQETAPLVHQLFRNIRIHQTCRETPSPHQTTACEAVGCNSKIQQKEKDRMRKYRFCFAHRCEICFNRAIKCCLCARHACAQRDCTNRRTGRAVYCDEHRCNYRYWWLCGLRRCQNPRNCSSMRSPQNPNRCSKHTRKHGT